MGFNGVVTAYGIRHYCKSDPPPNPPPQAGDFGRLRLQGLCDRNNVIARSVSDVAISFLFALSSLLSRYTVTLVTPVTPL